MLVCVSGSLVLAELRMVVLFPGAVHVQGACVPEYVETLYD